MEWPDEDAKTMGPIYVVDEALAAKAGKAINTPGWLPAQWVVDLFAPNDLRRTYFESRSIQHEKSIWDNIMVISNSRVWLFGYQSETSFGPIAISRWQARTQSIPHSRNLPHCSRSRLQILNKETDAADYLKRCKPPEASPQGLLSRARLCLRKSKMSVPENSAFEGFRLGSPPVGYGYGAVLLRHCLTENRHLFQRVLRTPYIEFSSPQVGAWGIPQNEINTNPNIKPQNLIGNISRDMIH